MNAAKQEKANADAAALLAKEKRKALEAVEQANDAMREAKRLQAAATAKYDQAEALLAQYGLADVPPCAAAAPEGRGGYSSGRVRAMSAYQSNVKVEPPCVARSASNAGFDRSKLHHTGQHSGEFQPHAPAWGVNEQPAAAG